jgi:hypothetical protein
MFKKLIQSRFVLIIARVMDYRIGTKDEEKPNLPILTVEEALISLSIKFLILLINFIACAFVIANVIHHW